MQIPLRPYNLDLSTRWPKAIIIHDTKELDLNNGNVSLDKSKFQTDRLQQTNYELTKQQEPPYHYIVEKVGTDFQVVVNRPLLSKCVFDDLPREHDESIHIALLGDYDNDIASNRLYTVVAYRLLVPFIRLFKISETEIYTHKELSSNKELSCPGEFFNMAKLRNMVKIQIRKVAVTRN